VDVVPGVNSVRLRGRSARPRNLVRWVLPALLLVFIINWFWAGAEAARIGGTFIGGYVRDGRYFVQNHNVFTEVDRATWDWSVAHTIVTLATWPFALVIILLLSRVGNWRSIRPTFLSQAGMRRDEIEASGPAYLSAAPGFQVPNASFPPGTSTFAFHRDGVIITPPIVGPRAIARGDVDGIEERDSGEQPAVVVYHSAPDLGSPLTVVAEPGGEIGAAIRTSLGPLVGPARASRGD
jgi:hypothetical protein